MLEDEPLKEPTPNASEEDQSYYSQYMEDALDVQCIMLSSMSPELQRQHENMSAREIDQHLRELFQESARVERYETSRALFRTMLEEGNQVGSHVLKMIGYIERLESLGSKLDQDLAVDLILSSLPPSFSQFVLNFNMNSMDKSLTDLMVMLKTAEKDMKVNPSLHAMMVRKTNKRSGTGKFNPKANAVKNPKYQAQKKLKKGMQVPQSDEKEAMCFHCGKKGHWKKNCYIFMKKNASGADASGIFMIECNLSISSSWVIDSRSSSHICVNMQGLSGYRRLSKDKMDLRVANGARVAALAVGTYSINLPSGLVLNLENCYFVPSFSKNIISVSSLDTKGFVFQFKDKLCSFYLNNIFYGNGSLNNGL